MKASWESHLCHEPLVPQVGGRPLVENLPVLQPAPPCRRLPSFPRRRLVGLSTASARKVEAGHDLGEVVLAEVEHPQLLAARPARVAQEA